MNYFDIILAGLLLFGLVRGFMRGFFVEAAALVGLILGLYGAVHFSYIIHDFLIGSVGWKGHYSYIVAFAITFIIIGIAVMLLGRFLTTMAAIAALGLVNKVFGAVFGVLKMALILGVILFLFERARTFEFVGKKTLETSLLYRPLKSFGRFVFLNVLRATEKEAFAK
jgi:membrane protein required for colicin V production